MVFKDGRLYIFEYRLALVPGHLAPAIKDMITMRVKEIASVVEISCGLVSHLLDQLPRLGVGVEESIVLGRTTPL
jgi:hypothetical protein